MQPEIGEIRASRYDGLEVEPIRRSNPLQWVALMMALWAGVVMLWWSCFV